MAQEMSHRDSHSSFCRNKARHFVAGLSSGVASAVLLQPLDLLKTRIQQSGHRSLTSYLGEVVASPSKFRTLWRGTVPSALRTGFGSALYFTSLNSIRTYAAQTRLFGHVPNRAAHSSSLPTLSSGANLIAGAVARTFAGLVLMPMTVIKVRFESTLYTYQSMVGASADIYRTGGLRGFFSGFGATAVRDAPYAGMYVLFYELLKKQLGDVSTELKTRQNPNLPVSMIPSHATLVNFNSAIIAGAACSVISNPFDAIKTRIQLQPCVYQNTYQACLKMVMEEGTRSLLDGVILRMSRKAISSALAWTVYEELIKGAECSWSANLTTRAEP